MGMGVGPDRETVSVTDVRARDVDRVVGVVPGSAGAVGDESAADEDVDGDDFAGGGSTPNAALNDPEDVGGGYDVREAR